MEHVLPLKVESRYEYLSISWTRSPATGLIRPVRAILEEESEHPEVFPRGSRLLYAWGEGVSVEFASTWWFQVGGHVAAHIRYAVAVSEEHNGTSVFVCTPIDAATHHWRKTIADKLHERCGAVLQPMPLSSLAADLLRALERHESAHTLALRVQDSSGQIRSLVRPGRTRVLETLRSLEAESSVVGAFLSFAGLVTFVQPRLVPGGEPILLMEPTVSTTAFEQAIWQMEDFFCED